MDTPQPNTHSTPDNSPAKILVPATPPREPVVSYIINDEQELQRVELEKNLYLRVIKRGSNKYINLCKFYKGYPTKKYIEMDYKTFNIIKKIIE